MLKLREIPDLFTDLATIYEAPAYQLQFIGAGTSCDICARLATPSEQRAKKNGELPPNKRETWLDTQARALYQACEMIIGGKFNENANIDTIKENKKFPAHRFRAVVGFKNHPAKIAYFMAQYRAKEWAEQAREVAGDRFAGYQITERIGEHNYIYKEGRQ